MSPAPFRHIGGGLVSDHGVLNLAAAEALARFYAGEATRETGAAARLCAARAEALHTAVNEARRWRRAAGWAKAEAADAPP